MTPPKKPDPDSPDFWRGCAFAPRHLRASPARAGEEPAAPLPVSPPYRLAGPLAPARGPAFSGADFAALAPMTEAIAFLQAVTGIVAVDLVRNLEGEVVGVVARGRRELNIGLRLTEEEPQ